MQNLIFELSKITLSETDIDISLQNGTCSRLVEELSHRSCNDLQVPCNGLQRPATGWGRPAAVRYAYYGYYLFRSGTLGHLRTVCRWIIGVIGRWRGSTADTGCERPHGTGAFITYFLPYYCTVTKEEIHQAQFAPR